MEDFEVKEDKEKDTWLKEYKEYKEYILPAMFILGAIVMGVNGVEGYGWMIFGAIISANIL